MKKSTKLGIIVACSAALFSLNSLLFNSEKVEAATSISGTLVPGEAVDTGNHILDSTFQQNKNNWSVLSGSTSWYQMQDDNYFRLANSQTGSWTYHVMNATIDFSKPVSISVPYSYKSKESGSWGDAAGFFLTPEDKDTIQENGPNATGKYLGIQGLPNSFFVGRDPWNNKGFDTSLSETTKENILIRQTDALGNVETSNSVVPGWPQKAVPVTYSRVIEGLFQYSYEGGETQTLTWTNISDNGDGTYTGTLSLLSSLNSTPLQRTVTMRHQMTFGSVGITGANTGIIREGNATSAASFSAIKGTSSVKINYINNSNDTLIKQAPASSIIANTGDTIGVTNGTLNSLDTYDYTAPQISNYTFLKAESIAVESSGTSAVTTNEINVYYTPELKTATLRFYYSKGTPGTGEVTDAITGLVGGSPESKVSKVEGLAQTLPDTITTTGYYDSSLKDFIGDSGIPLGYEIDYVVGPDGKNGKIYPDLKTAMNANPQYEDIDTNAWANYFSVYLKAKATSTSFTYKYLEGTRPNAPTLPEPLVQKGLTGGIISDPTQTLAALPKGATLESVTGPDGKNYNTLSEAVASDNNKYFSSVPNNFVINIVAAPVSVTIEEAPELDFGTQGLKGTPIYSMSPQGELEITDDTGTNKGWSVSANLKQQFTTDTGQTINGATLTFDKGVVSPIGENNSIPPVSSEFTLSESGPANILNAKTDSGQGSWQIEFSNVSLNTYNSGLVMNQEYHATVEWSISNVPN